MNNRTGPKEMEIYNSQKLSNDVSRRKIFTDVINRVSHARKYVWASRRGAPDLRRWFPHNLCKMRRQRMFGVVLSWIHVGMIYNKPEMVKLLTGLVDPQIYGVRCWELPCPSCKIFPEGSYETARMFELAIVSPPCSCLCKDIGPSQISCAMLHPSHVVHGQVRWGVHRKVVPCGIVRHVCLSYNDIC